MSTAFHLLHVSIDTDTLNQEVRPIDSRGHQLVAPRAGSIALESWVLNRPIQSVVLINLSGQARIYYFLASRIIFIRSRCRGCMLGITGSASTSVWPLWRMHLAGGQSATPP